MHPPIYVLIILVQQRLHLVLAVVGEHQGCVTIHILLVDCMCVYVCMCVWVGGLIGQYCRNRNVVISVDMVYKVWCGYYGMVWNGIDDNGVHGFVMNHSMSKYAVAT